MKRIASIQDISCLGRCSLTVALPVISAMAVECAIVPTAVLSTHTMFPGFISRDLSDQLLPIARHWKSQKVRLDAIGSGYLMEEGREMLEDVDCRRLTLDTAAGDTPLACTVWIDTQTLLPRYAEFASDGTVVISAKLLAFSCTLNEEEN